MLETYRNLQVAAIFAILLASAAGVALPIYIWKSNDVLEQTPFRVMKVILLLL